MSEYWAHYEFHGLLIASGPFRDIHTLRDGFWIKDQNGSLAKLGEERYWIAPGAIKYASVARGKP